MKMFNMQALCVFICADVWDFLLKKLWTNGRLYVPRIMYRLYYDFSYKVFMVIYSLNTNGKKQNTLLEMSTK